MAEELRNLGVEEEFQLVDAETGELRPSVEAVLPEAREALGEEVQPELQRSMIEIDTPVCTDLAEVRRELVRLRREVAAAAGATGCRIAALGTMIRSAANGDAPGRASRRSRSAASSSS